MRSTGEPSSERQRRRMHLLLLLLLALAVRAPFFFSAVVDWDESTYILLGQDLLDGHLPGTNLVDHNPLVYVAYAGFLLVFGKSVMAVRMGGLLCVYAAAGVLYELGARIRGKAAGFFAGAWLIIGSTTLSRSGGATMTEHVALLPLSMLVFALLAGAQSARRIFLMGLAAGFAGLIRANLFYLGPALALIVLAEERAGGAKRVIGREALLLLGGLTPVAALAAVYLVAGDFDVFVTVSFKEAAAYSAAAGSIGRRLGLTARLVTHSLSCGGTAIWIAFICGVTHMWVRRRETAEPRHAAALLTLFGFCLWSIMDTGPYFSHYLMQLLPFMCVPGGAWLASLCAGRDRVAMTLAGLLLLSPIHPVLNATSMLVTKIRSGRGLYSDRAYRIAEYLNKRDVEGEYVLFLVDHIGYWLTGAKLPTRHAHPSNLGKPESLSVYDEWEEGSLTREIGRALAKRPVYIVWKPDSRVFPLPVKDLVARQIRKHYVLAARIDRAEICRRKDFRPGAIDVKLHRLFRAPLP